MCCNCKALSYYDKSNIIIKTIDYMKENYMNSISLDEISKNIHLNPIYFCKIFKEETGDSLINYLIGIRLCKARELLSKGDFTVKEVAAMVGYSDPYYFSKLFKRYYGCSPTKYRNKAKKR